MSHVATIELEIKDLDMLEAACTELGLELARGQQTYRWYGHSVGDFPLPKGFKESDLGKCEHAIRIPGSTTAYEIGVTPRKDGKPGFTLLWDFWSGGKGMMAKVGEEGHKLVQEYAAQIAIKEIKKKGFSYNRSYDQKGNLVIAARRMARKF